MRAAATNRRPGAVGHLHRPGVGPTGPRTRVPDCRPGLRGGREIVVAGAKWGSGGGSAGSIRAAWGKDGYVIGAGGWTAGGDGQRMRKSGGVRPQWVEMAIDA